METITRISVFKFWLRDITNYIDDCNEFDTTIMGERAAEHFGVMSEDGNTHIEKNLFDWAVEFSNNIDKYI